MKKWLSLIILLAVNVISINAQQKNSINNQKYGKENKNNSFDLSAMARR